MNGASEALPFNNNIGESIPADTPHVCTILRNTKTTTTNFNLGCQRLATDMESQCRL